MLFSVNTFVKKEVKMFTFSDLLLFAHLIGLTLGVGSATVKLV